MQKIKGILETVIFSLNGQPTSVEEREIITNLLEIKKLMGNLSIELLEEKALELQGERQVLEEKFVRCLENINVLEEHLVAEENRPLAQTSYLHEQNNISIRSPLRNHNIWGAHHLSYNQDINDIYDLESKTLEKENSILLKMKSDNSDKIDELESNLKNFQSENKAIFSKNLELVKDIRELDNAKKNLIDLESELMKRVENNKKRLLFYENKFHLLETINRELVKRKAFLNDENEKLRFEKQQNRLFYEEKLKELEKGSQDKLPIEASFISDRLSNNNRGGLLESFHRKSIKGEDFLYFKNSVIRNLQHNETFSINLEKKSLNYKNEINFTVVQPDQEMRNSALQTKRPMRTPQTNHRRNKSEFLSPPDEKPQNDRLMTIKSLSFSEISESSELKIEEISPQKKSPFHKEEVKNINFQERGHQHFNNKVNQHKNKKEINFQKEAGLNPRKFEEEKTNSPQKESSKNAGKHSCEQFCIIF